MKILVIGVSGQLSQSLMRLGNDGGMDIRALGRPDFDLTDETNVHSAMDKISPEVVINAAAYTAVDRAEDEPEQAFLVNETGPRNLARACEARNLPFIHISTDYVFDGEKDGAYTEDDPVGPTGVYGKSKLAGEIAVAEACARHLILRTSWVYSPYGQNFVKTMLRLARERDELNVVDDQVGNPTYAPHLAQCILDIVAFIKSRESGEVPWGIYHAAGTGHASWCDLARETFDCSRKSGGASAVAHAITSDQYPTPARRPLNSKLDCSRLSQAFEHELPHWKLGVEECVTLLASEKQVAPG